MISFKIQSVKELGRSCMKNKEWVIETVKAHIGQETFRDANNFFNIINDMECDIIIFVSRKAYLMFEIAQKCGFSFNKGKKVYSDRIISKPYKPAKSRFDGKKILLVDDTVTNAFAISNLYKRFMDSRNGYKCDSVSIFVFATNTEHKISDEMKSCLSTHIMMTPVQISDFSLMEAKLVHELGMVYFLELPVYHADFVSKKLFNHVQERLDAIHNDWQKEPYMVSAKLWFYEDYFLVPKNGGLVPSIFPDPFEFVKYNYVEHKLEDGEEERYSFNFVPVKILEYIDDSFAIEFMLKLSNALPAGAYLRQYLGELLCGWGDEATIENIHRSVTYILSYCLGVEFFDFLNLKDVKMEQVSKDAHLSADFVKFVESIELNDVVTVKKILMEIRSNRKNCELPERLEATLQEQLASVASLDEYLEDVAKKGFRNFVEGLMKTCKYNKGLPKRLSLNSIVAGFGEKPSASVLRSVVMSAIETSTCSFSTLSYKHNATTWILKALTPGENSFTDMYNQLPPKYFNALNMFMIGAGGYEEMKSHLDVFQKNCVPILEESGEPYVDVEKIIIGELSDESLFDRYYTNTIRENITNTFSQSECDLYAYQLGEPYARECVE